MNIPYLSFNKMHSGIRADALAAMQEVFDSSWYIMGKAHDNFEREYAEWNGVRYCAGISNGLDALHLSLKAMGVGEGDEVIVPSNTYIATVLAVSFTGAKPVLAEPNEATCNIDPANIEKLITPKTKVILPVHLYGQICEMEAIMEIANRHNLFVLEDNAQSHGAEQKGQLAGSFGHLSATSFYPGKNLGALGDAGAVTSNDEQLIDKVKVLRNYGSRKKYYNEVQGYNCRLDEMQAAVLSVKLKKLRYWNIERQGIAERYLKQLAGIPGLTLPCMGANCSSVWHIFMVRHPKRDELQAYLTAKGIGTLIHYPVPVHLQEAYRSLGYKKGDFPIAERMAETCLSLPLYPGLSVAEVDYICDTIRQFPS